MPFLMLHAGSTSRTLLEMKSGNICLDLLVRVPREGEVVFRVSANDSPQSEHVAVMQSYQMRRPWSESISESSEFSI